MGQPNRKWHKSIYFRLIVAFLNRDATDLFTCGIPLSVGHFDAQERYRGVGGNAINQLRERVGKYVKTVQRDAIRNNER